MDYENLPANGGGASLGADGDGAFLVPEIAAAAAAVARTGGVPLLPDANGVIVLPAGATLDDIKVVGRDLVVTLDNGQVFVIPEGAVYVPQIVIDGVAVPPLNLAALLIGEEPIEPAAGLARSSGNNFFEPAGDIQDPFPLGDLLPPTEFTRAVEDEEEVIPQAIDSTPTLVIITPNAPAGGIDVTATVAESGLPARVGEPAGSNAAANTEATSGTIVFTSIDGIDSLTINGVAVTGAGQTIVSPRGTLTITAVDLVNGTIGFTYTLTDNLVGGTLADQFTVVLTDGDGDTATSTLTVNVTDDAPTARNDTDAVAAGTFAAELGNVVTGAGTTSGAAGADTPGADGATITRIASNAIPANADTTFDGAGNLQVAGQYGTLLIRADGSYSYTRAAGTPGGVSEAFTYTLTDADGSASTATLTIAIADAAPAFVSIPPSGGPGAIVAESGLPARGNETPGSNAPAPTETTAGTITFNPGDGPATVTINGTPVAVGAVITTPSGTLTVTAFNPVAGTIGYTFTLTDNTAGDTTTASFTVVVTDADGDSATGTLTIAITDDVPTAVNDSATQATENTAVTVNVLANDIQGADGVANSAVAAVPGTLSGAGTLTYNNNGTFTYTPAAGEQGTVTFDYTITDGDGDTSRATVTITLLTDSTPGITLAGDGSVDEAALGARAGEPAGSNAVSNDETAVGTIAIATGGDTLASLVINGVNVTAGGTVTTAKGVLTVTVTAGGYGYSYTLSDNTLADPESDTFSIVATDSDGDTATTSLVVTIADDRPTAADDANTIAAGTFGPVGGNVLANDVRGADDVVVQSYSGVTAGNAGATVQGQYGTLTIAADGTYSYARNPGTPGGVSDTFAYTVVDGDGDTSTANLVIAIADSGATLTIPPAGAAGSTQVLEAGLPTGSDAAGNGEFAGGSFTFTAPDGPAIVTIGGTAVTAVGQTITGSFGTLTITSIAAGSVGYTYQLTTRTNGDDTADSFAVVVTDQDGDAASGSLVISIVDDVPTARADIDSVREDGPTVATGNVLTGVDLAVMPDANATDGVADTPGADGAAIISVTYNGVTGGPGTFGTTYGAITIAPNGGYRYTLNNANPLVQGLDGDDTLTETFTYTIRDADGDLSSTTLTITIQGNDDGVTIAGLNVPNGELAVNEANLADGSSPNAAALTQSNSFTVAGVDGVATIVVGGATVFANGAFVPGQTVVTPLGTLTITNVVPVKDAAGDTVSATVSYSYTLTDNTLGHTGANGETLFDSFGVTVTDSDGSTATGTIDVLVRDDTPTARFDSDSVAEDGPLVADGNLLTGVGGTDANATDGVADIQGADSAQVSAIARFDGVTMFPGTLGAPLAGLYGSLTVNADGSYVYTLDNANGSVQGLDGDDTLTELFSYTITDGDGDTSTANLLITIRGADDAVSITGLNIAGGEETVFEANLADGSSPDAAALVQTGSFTVAGPDGLTSVTVNGLPILNAAGALIVPPISNAAFGTLQITGATVVRDPSGEIVSATFTYSYTLNDSTAHTGANDAQLTDSFTVVVTDSDGSTATDTLDVVVVDDTPTARADVDSVGEDSAAPATGNVITGVDGGGLPDANATDGVADTQGADGATVTAIAFNPAAGGSVAGTVGGATPGQYGLLSLSSNGAYVYTVNSALAAVQGLDDGETLTETFTYTITDGDGDAATTTLTITITGSNDAPVVGTGAATVSEEGLAFGNADAAGNPDTTDATVATGTISIVDPDGEASTVTLGDPGAVLTADGQPVTWSGIGTGTLIGSVGAVEVIRIAIDNTGAYTVTLSQSVDHPTINQEDVTSFIVPVSVSDGTVTVPTTLTVTIEDDSPTATDDGRTTIEGAAALTGNVLANDASGADTPAAVSAVSGGSVGTAFAGAFGTLLLNADGSYTYTPNASVPSGSVDSFTYTLRDADGDTATATLSFTFQGDANLPTAGTTTATVDDDALAGGNAGGSGDDDANATESPVTASEAVFSGTLPATFGLDGAGKISFAHLDGLFGIFGSESVQYSWNEAASTLTGTGPRGALFTVVVDQASGAYTFTLLDNVLHAGGGAENNATNLVISYQVIDSDGSIATGTLRIDADDDTPTIDVTAGADAGVLLTTRDANTIGAASDTATSAAQFGGVFVFTASPGADGAPNAPALSYALNVANTSSGLRSSGAAITLTKLADGTVVGYTGAVAPTVETAATVVFSVKVDGAGAVTLTQFQQVDHATEFPNTEAPFDDQFAILGNGRITLTASASVTDGDGDSASDSETIDLGGNIRFADDGPVLTNVATGAGVTLDETAAGANFVNGPISATSASAVITATRAFGADGPADGSIALGTSYGLIVVGGGATPLKTAIGDFAITLVQVNAETIAGRYNDGAVKTAFTLTIGLDGRVTVVQNVALEHNVDGGTAADYNDPLGLAGLVNATITIKDSEGDTATSSAGIGGNIVFLDDGVLSVADSGTVPAGSAAPITGNVLANDYRGADGSAISAVSNAGAGTSGVLAAGSFTIAGQYGTLTLNASTGAYTYTHTPGAGGGSSDVFSYTLTDNDGDFSTTTLTISIGDTQPVATTASATVDDEGLAGGIAGAVANGDIDANAGDLDATSEAIFKGILGGTPGDGVNTFLFGAALAGTTQAMGQETVTYAVSADGSLLTATITASPDAARLATTLFTIKITDQASGAYTLTLVDNVLHPNANAENDVDITVGYQLRDADLDLSTTGVLSIKFDDDTPTAEFLVAPTITDDEGKGPFPGIEGGAGDVPGSPSVASGAVGSLFNPGADGLRGLTIVAPPGVKAIYQGTASGNLGTGQQEAVTYTYATAADGAVTVTGRGAVSGQVVFTLTIGADGSYTFTQSRALVQIGGNESDLGLGFTFTVTDRDGDGKSGLLTVNVDDDTPIAFTPVAASTTNTGTAVLTGALDTVGNGIFDNAGADGIQSLTFAAALNGTKLTGANGTVLTSGGNDIFLYVQSNGTLIASTDSTPATLDSALTVFTASLNAGTGQYTIDFDRTIDNGSGTQVADFRATRAGNNQWNGVDSNLVNGAAIDIAAANDPNPDSTDLLFTPSAGGTINTSSTDIGVSNQFVDADEALRVDLVQDLRRDPGATEANAGGYLYDTHSAVSQATFRILQIQGNGTGTVRISASNVDDANPLSQSAVGTAAINTAVNLNHATVQVRNAAGVIQTDVTIYNAGNDIVISGIEAGDSVTFGAELNATFESFTIDNAAGDPVPGGSGNLGGRPFGVGGFAFNTVALGSPVQFSLPVVLTDGDGDTSTGSIAVTVNPVVPVALDLDGDGVEFVGLRAGVTFDYNGDGTFAATSWVGGDDGILAFDGNANRAVDGGAEIVFGGNGLTDLEGLAARFDSNHDGVLDANDADFAKFGVWQDANGNGKTDAGEFHTLAELGITAIGLASDKQAYSAAGGDVQVAGTASFTRADGSTGAVADAAFTATPLERMAARAAEAAAGNAAAAGYLAAAAAAASALPAAASEAPATVSVVAPEGGETLAPAPGLHVERHVENADLTAGAPDKAAAPASSAHHAEPADTVSLSAIEDRASDASPADATPAAAPASAMAFTDAGGGQLMEALLAAAQAAKPAAGEGAQHPQDVAAVLEAFGDSHGAALVDAVVDHFAGADAALPFTNAGSEALAGLLSGAVSGSEGFAGGFDLAGLLDDHGATAAAQV